MFYLTRNHSPEPALSRVGVTRLRPGAWLNPSMDVALNIPAITTALRGGEEVS